MKKKFFSILAVMLMALTANAEKTITWDYNTIKGIDFSTEAHYHSGADSYRPIISKDGITWLGFVDAYSSIHLENCNLGTNTSHDYASTLFFSNIGSISSIIITCDDGEGTIYDEDYNEWATSQTSVVWTNGGFNTKVNMPLKEKSEIKGITQITFTVEDNDIRSYIAYGFPVSWKVNDEYTDGVYETWAGETLLVTPYTNRVITNIKAIDATSYKTTYLTNNGNGTWILPSMPAYNVMIVAEYEGDMPDPGTKYAISNIPSGWKVNGSTTSGTYEATEGAKVIFTPANIPAGKKIKSIKVVKQ